MKIESGLPIGPWGITVDNKGIPWARFLNIMRARRLSDGSTIIILHNREHLVVPSEWNITLYGKVSEYA